MYDVWIDRAANISPASQGACRRLVPLLHELSCGGDEYTLSHAELQITWAVDTQSVLFPWFVTNKVLGSFSVTNGQTYVQLVDGHISALSRYGKSAVTLPARGARYVGEDHASIAGTIDGHLCATGRAPFSASNIVSGPLGSVASLRVPELVFNAANLVCHYHTLSCRCYVLHGLKHRLLCRVGHVRREAGDAMW